MRDRGLIVAGLILFLGVLLFPIWYNLAAGRSARMPALQLPSQEKECVAPVSYMKTSHMKLLYRWRDQAVRDGRRTYAAYNGKAYAISLTGTCLRQCHGDRVAFCDRCHAYSGAGDPLCWECHIDARTAPSGQPAGAGAIGESDAR